MDVSKLITELKTELERIDQAISALETVAQRRGHASALPSNAIIGKKKRSVRRKRVFSPESRKRMAEAQRRRWAAKRNNPSS